MSCRPARGTFPVKPRAFRLGAVLTAAFLAASLGADAPPSAAARTKPHTDPAFRIVPVNEPKATEPGASKAEAQPLASATQPLSLEPTQVIRTVQTVALFAAISLAPAALLMVTAFVRINIVLVLLRQALGSPQVPGNPVLTALALLLTALVMRPTGEAVYSSAIQPYRLGKIDEAQAWRNACRPVKTFMLEQIERTNHERYVWKIFDEIVAPTPGRVDPVDFEDFPMRVVAPAFLLSEITTALVIGFYLYLPFLVVDLVVSAVLATMGLFMLPPALVALPLKLILFVLADGWLHVATMLVRSFGPS